VVVGVPDRSDYTTGESAKVGAWVDEGIYTAFREWVEEQEGKQYAAVGDALERAMLEYMDKDRYERIESELSDVSAQGKKNEALLRQVLDRMDGEKEREKRISDDGPPQGKDPGSRRKREAHVIRAILVNEYETVTRDVLAQAVKEVAEVSTNRIIKDYVGAITDTEAFQSHPKPSRWRFDADGAREVLESRGVTIPEMIES
jgi:hypothetical protein